MSIFEIPNNGQIRTSQRSETLGEILESFCIDLNNPTQKISPSRKLVKVLDETDAGGANSRLQALAVYKKQNSGGAGRYFAIFSDEIMVCTTTDDPTNPANWSDVGTAFAGIFDLSGIGDESDAVVFNDLLLVSKSQNILSWNGTSDDPDWWTTVSLGGETGPALTAGYPHIMLSHKSGTETLFVTNQNKVHYANTAAGHSTITLAQDLVACCLASDGDAVWVGTYNTGSGGAYVYEVFVGQVDEFSTPIANRSFKIDGNAVLSIAVLNSIPYIITDRGNLQAFNGAGFVTVARLPFVGTSFVLDGVRIGNIDDDNIQRPVHPKGMQAHNDSLFILVNSKSENIGFSQAPYGAKTPSGVYEFNTLTGQLHHHYGLSETADTQPARVFDFSGPLLITDTPYTFLLAGAEIDDSTAGLFAENASQYGYFITPEINSETVQDAYEALFVKKDGLGDVSVRYRSEKRDNIYATGTLANSNQVNLTGVFPQIEAGDEVTFINTANHGKTANVVSVSTSDTVTSLVVDASLGTAGDTATVEVTNFKDVGDSVTEGSYLHFGTDVTNTWIQYKVIMTGDVSVRHLISKGTAKTTV